MISSFINRRRRPEGKSRGQLISSLRGVVVVLTAGSVCLLPGSSAASDDALWNLLRSGGHAALLRHAIAPGTGDPPEFTVDDCGTQRNLSDKGRSQAVRIGERFRNHGIAAARVFSSQWCRCLETADLLGLGPVKELPALNSFFQRYERRDAQTRELRDWLSAQDPGQVLVLVTHQVNISALTDVYPSSGELVVVRRSENGELSVAGTIESD